jgi:hypothetical protein
MKKKTTRKKNRVAVPAKRARAAKAAPRKERAGKAEPLSKRDFLAHIHQYLHYVEDIMCTFKYKGVGWKESTLRQKGEQIKEMIRAIE